MRKQKDNDPKGFTLLELLISLTILSIIVVLVFGALRIGVKAWRKGEDDLHDRQVQRIVLDLIWRQLVSVSSSDADNPERSHLFQGEQKLMRFVSHKSLLPENRFGKVKVAYAVNHKGEGGENLSILERPLVWMDEFQEETDISDGEYVGLYPGAESIFFEYLSESMGMEPNLQWQPTWDPEVDKGFPGAVRVTVQLGGEAAPIRIIARISTG